MARKRTKMPGTRMDIVKFALIINIAAIVVSLVTAGVVAWTNAGSRNLALAVGTFVAAVFLFLIQLPFELQRSVVRDWLSTSITIDRAKPEIRQWVYSSPPGASSWLASNNPAAFSGDRERSSSEPQSVRFPSPLILPVRSATGSRERKPPPVRCTHSLRPPPLLLLLPADRLFL